MQQQLKGHEDLKEVPSETSTNIENSGAASE
jgi:hypothetical protein